MNIKTAEFVSPRHPDKICDQIADAILDAYLIKDKYSRTAIEVIGGHNLIVVLGEVKSSVNINKIPIMKIIKSFVGDKFDMQVHLEKQSSEISKGVDMGGAGDQGIMIGYACDETKNHMPLEYELARNLCRRIYQKYPYDGKTQVTLGGNKVLRIVASFQNTKTKELENLVKSIIKSKEYIINPAGDWKIGGFEADSGLTGRKLIVDSYGPRVPVGGGSFSGKDPTKVDRSGAYMARRIAVDYLRKYKAKEVLVKLAYAIGQEEPLMKLVIIDGKEKEIKDYDLKPNSIIKFLDLRNPIYTKTSQWGHFGNGFKWDC
ncbi:MAG TPA: methionine adenosyltransferase domain-containing protein [Candidatus Paceibacterota bacterium]|nr:methionine adenosyltransferase domain-containing protein [Candidatus Paceibacterota bacterium]